MATPPKNPTDGTAKPPAPRKPATPRKTTTRKTAATASKPAARKTPTASARPAAEAPAPKPALARKPAAKPAPAAKKPAPPTGSGRKWGIAAAVGGIGAVATAALLALRGSTPAVSTGNPGRTAPPEGGAHQADGSDSSRSFEAGIADEGTIPE